MKSNIRYADGVFMALGLAYIILGTLNLFGKVQAKIILLCSIVSFVIAIVQILDSFISSIRIVETNVLKASLCMLQAWYDEHMDLNKEDIKKKISEFNRDRCDIQKRYARFISSLCIISNVILTVSIAFFLIGVSTDFVKENTALADTLTLFSFAIIFISLVLHTQMDNYVEKFNQLLESTIDMMEEK